MSGSPPLRFLAIVLGGWAAARTVLVVPSWWAPPAGASPAQRQSAARPAPRPGPAAPPTLAAQRAFAGGPGGLAIRQPRRPGSRGANPAAPTARLASTAAGEWRGAAPARAAVPVSVSPSIGPAPARASTRRWSLSAWAFARRGDPAALAANGTLGGSQAGARFAYRLGGGAARPLALSLRLSSPLGRAEGAEAAPGLDWRPARRLPIHFLAERRQALGREGRSAFAILVYGGVGDARLGPLRIDAYGQAGFVGIRSRDPFGDGALRLSIPLGARARLGAGAWAAAQPGLARLDIGPQASLRLPITGRPVTLAADWRLRAAGNAEPGSGPTLTIATDF